MCRNYLIVADLVTLVIACDDDLMKHQMMVFRLIL